MRTANSAAMLNDPTHKFHTFWGKFAWKNKGPNDGSCWDYDPQFLDKLNSREQCDVNWLEGAMGGQYDRPPFTTDAPALLGFDGDIGDYCSEKSQLGDWGPGDWNKELARRCVAGNQNILRIMFSCANCWGARKGWDMCRNLQWVLCAARGWLPGQNNAGIYFAKAPRDLDTRDLDDPSRTGSWWQEPHYNHYAVSDVFFGEVVLLSTLCKNSWQLFTVRRGERFDCDYYDAGYQTLVAGLRK